MGYGRNPLDPFFDPASVAVIGATEKEGSVGRTVFWNLISSPFGGTVYPVNQKRASILGVRAYPNLAALPETPELVVVATPAPTIPATIEKCAAAGVKAVVIISAGFKEVGPEGAELERRILCTNGEVLRVRPIRPEDEPLVVELHRTLSEETVFQRYLAHLGLSERTAHERLIRICFVDYQHEMALVAEQDDPVTGRPTIVGIGRLSRVFGTDDAEFAVLVTDPWQGRGIGTELLRRLVEIARAEGVAVIGAQMRVENTGMRKASERVGFTIMAGSADDLVRAQMQL
jgi:RimJ/RimL family protein N-acetyltransferase